MEYGINGEMKHVLLKKHLQRETRRWAVTVCILYLSSADKAKVNCRVMMKNNGLSLYSTWRLLMAVAGHLVFSTKQSCVCYEFLQKPSIDPSAPLGDR
jgi:hypothetical protein